MDEQIKEQFKAMDKRLEDQNKKNDGRFDELVKMIKELGQVSTNCSTEVLRDSSGNDTWNNGGSDIVEQFNKLQQTGSIETYIDEFDNLRSLMEQHNLVLPDTYFLDSFVGGLKTSVKPFVKAFKPTTVTEAIRYARLQEENLQALNSKKYDRGHKCRFKETQLFAVEIPSCDSNESEGSLSEDELEVPDPCISVNALSGSQNFSTMRVKGQTQNQLVHILIDSGGTHNFLDINLASKLGCQIEPILPQSILVADGVQWLSTLGNVYWDFKNLLMEFKVGNKVVKLKRVKEIEYNQLTDQKNIVAMTPDKNQELEYLKKQYADIFMEPDKLPPPRQMFDHRIPLQEGTNPINIRPYRYPLKQRDVIEQIIEEMLSRGIIQNSTSPFASPVVLVRKKDGTWRLCVDYRELNKRTVKDKFPIPVVEELIDELAGSNVFSKIDLRAGYHQLRVHKDDVFETVFKTHS
ncbi:hypothetical protein AgCh_032728 [Apium graveolens]